MDLAGSHLICPLGHSFDVAKQGYVNLLNRGAPKNADTADMVAARERFLREGWFSPIAAAVTDRMHDAHRVLEVGAGSAYYLTQALPADAYGLATDVSVPACRRAAKAHPRVAAVVADTWAGLPIGSGAVDTALCVFAPRNPAEFHRVLAPGGNLVIVTPEPGHLRQLRSRDGLLEIRAGKDHEIREAFDAWSLRDEEVLAYDVELPGDAATDLVAMGPNAFHRSGRTEAVQVTVAVHVWTVQKA